MESITLTAPDISCAHCKNTIEREIGGMAGVGSCQVDIDGQQVRVRFDPTQISSQQIAARLDEEGYPVAG